MSENAIVSTADARIERYRKTDATVRVTDQAGNPIPAARVKAEQTRHAFLFGCNAFPVLRYDDVNLEETYEREFADLFNYATLGFYWGSYEQEPGQTRVAHLKAQARWCRDHGITPKGHPLVWHEVYPRWGPSDVDETRDRLRARVAQIVGEFAGLVDVWDVVNEATVAANVDNGVGHWAKRDGPVAMVAEALSWARKANPKATLLNNDFNLGEDYEKLAAELLKADKNAVDAFGIQSHMHRGEWPIMKIWEACETYSRFGKPLHFTETTVLSGAHGWERPRPWPTTPLGEARQADYVERLYTVLFSHPAVQAITWWDFDDGEWQGAPAGLVRTDLTPKPVYKRLLALVKGKWWTRAEVKADSDGVARFRGFLGHYQIAVTVDGTSVTKEMDLAKGEENALAVVFE
jgi:GH35 family endo-1,4-beta-xylanase